MLADTLSVSKTVQMCPHVELLAKQECALGLWRYFLMLPLHHRLECTFVSTGHWIGSYERVRNASLVRVDLVFWHFAVRITLECATMKHAKKEVDM